MWRRLASFLLLLAAAPASAQPAASDNADGLDPFAVLRALDGFAALELWPGFDPRQVPVAIYDGQQTLLLRHPSPPEEFAPVPGRDGVYAFAGRHPAIRWVSTAAIGDVRTATMPLTLDPTASAQAKARLLVHETFHVYSMPRHPTWRPDEMVRYGYPIDDVEVDRLLLAEEQALAHALAARDRGETSGWAAVAFAAMTERQRRLTDVQLEYEQALELLEGTATHVERLVAGDQRDTTRMLDTPSPQGVRWRFYEIGAALAAVLDTLDEEWKARLEATPELTFEQMLGAVLSAAEPAAVDFTAEEREALRARAEERIAGLAAARAELRRTFAARGRPVIVDVGAGGAPLRFARFDPTAIEILEDGEALHANGLVMERRDGELSVHNPGFRRSYTNPSYGGVLCLTTPAGPHPIRQGVRRLAVAGFATRPTVEVTDGRARVEAEGLILDFAGAQIDSSDEAIVITLAPAAVETDAQAADVPSR